MAKTKSPACSPEEEVLISAAKSDPSKFTTLYDRYYRSIYRYLYSRTNSVPEAEDLTAQTFLHALEALPRYRHRGYFSAWLFTIARNQARDHFRRRQMVPLDESHPDPAADPIARAARSDQTAELSFLVKKLTEEEQELIRLRCAAGLSFAEIGASLGRKEDTVKKAFYRLASRLQHQLEVNHD